ncbi:MAG: DUF1579 domain-containing protein [Alphaproteobacteria bacterium]|nr:DUF1579 domain-containing protein [Alphaproteobacteria bacterium]MBU2380371.1 DUF1579 domain-containing protein [Alphaproteobacteria bacterium]
MSFLRLAVAIVAALTLTSAVPAFAQDGSANREAVSKLDFMRGVWVGEATGMAPNGQPYRITQTERIGPLLGGEILAIEGRGYQADGTTAFNAFAVVSWDATAGKYEMRSYALGRSGTFPFTLTEDGYVWEIPAGPGVVRYQAEVTAETFHEVGDFVMEGQPSRRMFEMTLTRRGDTDWPAAGAIDPAH